MKRRKISTKERYELEEKARAEMTGEELKLITDYERIVKEKKGKTYYLRPWYDEYGNKEEKKYRLFVDGKYRNVKYTHEIVWSVNDYKGVRPEKPANITTPKKETLDVKLDEKANLLERYIKSQANNKKEKEPLKTVGCNVTISEYDTLNEIAGAMGYKSISPVIKNFLKEMLKDKDMWLAFFKKAKN